MCSNYSGMIIQSMWKMPLTAFLLVLVTTLIPAYAEESLHGLPQATGPVEIQMGFNLLNITDVGEKEETIDFDGVIYLEWIDNRLVYDPDEYGTPGSWVPGDYSRAPAQIYLGEYAVREEFPGWRLHIVIPNGIGDRVTTNMAVRVWPDGRVAYEETFYAKAETPMDLRRFPFDSQDLEIFFHPFVYQRDEVILIPDDRLARTWNQNLGIADWARGQVTMEERPIEIAYFDESRSELSEFVVTVNIKRRPTHLLISIIFPMVLLVSLTWSVFWMDNESLGNRVNINFIGILSVVAYYFVILENVPEVSYLTLVDAFIIATFLILAAGVVMVVVMESISNGEDLRLRNKVDRVCRWAFPLSYAVLATILGAVFLKLY